MMFDIEGRIVAAVRTAFAAGGPEASIGSYYRAGESALTEADRRRIVEWYVREVAEPVLRQLAGA